MKDIRDLFLASTTVVTTQNLQIYLYIGIRMVSIAIWKEYLRVSFSKTIKIAQFRRAKTI
jgi:hypothetical protein